MVAVLWPSIGCTTFTFAPEAMARVAAVWRSRWGWEAVQARGSAASVNTSRLEHLGPQRPALDAGEHEVRGRLAGDVRRSSSTRKRGIGTSRRS